MYLVNHARAGRRSARSRCLFPFPVHDNGLPRDQVACAQMVSSETRMPVIKPRSRPSRRAAVEWRRRLLDGRLQLPHFRKFRHRASSRRLQVISGLAPIATAAPRNCKTLSTAANHSRNLTGATSLHSSIVYEIFEVAADEALHRLFDACSKFSKTLEIAAVAFEGVFSEPAFHLEMRQIRVDEIVGG